MSGPLLFRKFKVENIRHLLTNEQFLTNVPPKATLIGLSAVRVEGRLMAQMLLHYVDNNRYSLVTYDPKLDANIIATAVFTLGDLN